MAGICYQRLDTIKNDAKYFSENHEYIISYAKNIEFTVIKGLKRTFEHNKVYKNLDNDPRGPYLLTPLHAKSGNKNNIYTFKFKNGIEWRPPKGTFPRFSKETLKKLDEENRIYFKSKTPQKKTFLNEVSQYIKLTTFWDYKFAGSTRSSNKELRKILGRGMFDNPKSVKFLKILIDSVSNNSDIILDFFSGSATTAHAVMELNAEDDGNREFIMVQIPELTDEKSEAYKAGFRTICDIGRERIIRAGKKIKEDFKDKEYIDSLDFGFRYFKIDSSNFKEAKDISEITQKNLFDTIENIKSDRDNLDILFEVILNLGVELTLKIELKEILGKKVYFIDKNSLVVCFDDSIDEKLAKELASFHPLKIVLKDSSFKSDSDKINFEQTIKELSLETDIWVV